MMDILERNLLQVTKLSKARTLACNQEFFGEKGDIYYAYMKKPEKILILSKMPPDDTCDTVFVKEYGQKAGNQRGHVFTLCKEFCEALGVMPGTDYCTIREVMDGFAIQKSTQKEALDFGTKEHRKALVSGEVRGGSKPVLYLTREQKDAIGIGTHTTPIKMTVNTATGGYIRLSPLKESDEKLPTYMQLKSFFGKDLFNKEFSCKYNFPMCINFPAPIRKAFDIKSGDIMPVYIEGNSVVIERKEMSCSACGRKLKARTEKAALIRVCEPCSKAVSKTKEYHMKEATEISQNESNWIAGAIKTRNELAAKLSISLEKSGLTEKTVEGLKRLGLHTVEDLADLDLEMFSLKVAEELRIFLNGEKKNDHPEIGPSTSLQDCGLSHRTRIGLFRMGFHTVADLANFDLVVFASQRNIGAKSIAEMKEFLWALKN